jgi:hypothetical protein
MGTQGTFTMTRNASIFIRGLALGAALGLNACDSKSRDYTETTSSAEGDAGDDEATGKSDPTGSEKPEPSKGSGASDAAAPTAPASNTTPAPPTPPGTSSTSTDTNEHGDGGVADDADTQVHVVDTTSDAGAGDSPDSNPTAGESSAGGAPGSDAGTDGPVRGTGGEGTIDNTVRGRIIDFWNQPLPNVPVMIGDTIESTDADGHFEIKDVTDEYDVSFVVQWDGSDGGLYGWRYEGLTRRDPTLQASTGRSSRGGSVLLSASGAELSDTRKLAVAIGGADGASRHMVDDVTGVTRTTYWRGEATTQAGVHGLLWDTTDDLPTSYLGYDSGLTLLVEGGDNEIAVDLSATTDIAAGTVQGSVTSNGGSYRSNGLYLRFADGAFIDLVTDDYTAPDDFSYVAPTLPDASLLLSASTGITLDDQYAIAYRHGLTAGGDLVKLNIPDPRTALQPANGEVDVDENTTFGWSGDDGPVVIRIEASQYTEGFAIVTARKQTSLSSFVAGAATLISGDPYYWTVQTHGLAKSVDELADEDGFLDPFSLDLLNPLGPRQGEGAFTITQARGFTAK